MEQMCADHDYIGRISFKILFATCWVLIILALLDICISTGNTDAV